MRGKDKAKSTGQGFKESLSECEYDHGIDWQKVRNDGGVFR
jgi:hypothetical protein